MSLVVACASAAEGDAEADDGPPTFDDLDFDERVELMTFEVLPTMREIFQARDPERWAAFSCDTCHGPDFAALQYDMPQTLPALPRDGTLEAAEAIDPDMTAFMLDEVFPVMTELLGREKFHHDTAPNGFRCIGCHVEVQ